MLKIKRAYEPAETTDGKRILIDRLWPRGVSKSEAHIDEWKKDLAPSTELRKWFGHDPQRWEEFRKKYIQELSSAAKMNLLEDIAKRAKSENITLVYAAKDAEHSNAKILEELLKLGKWSGAKWLSFHFWILLLGAVILCSSIQNNSAPISLITIKEYNKQKIKESPLQSLFTNYSTN